MSEEITRKIEEALVKRISKDSPGAYYTLIDGRIITMRQARDVAEEIYWDHVKEINEDPNQDELWDDVENEFKHPKTVFRTSDLTTITSAKENLKKRYHITRVK